MQGIRGQDAVLDSELADEEFQCSLGKLRSMWASSSSRGVQSSDTLSTSFYQAWRLLTCRVPSPSSPANIFATLFHMLHAVPYLCEGCTAVNRGFPLLSRHKTLPEPQSSCNLLRQGKLFFTLQTGLIFNRHASSCNVLVQKLFKPCR